ncbi:MAG TPA: crossover junction endodeoxyribonuclease RuvC [Synergistales bacterium]|nr:crossover junction endodeoxyribonuclease RuvC [Synergistaceae bacterium]HOO88834.1 crossover junction endodeoxyribonuclease RuvC [Synergistales bacterium]HRV99160.1 crossover junction endodeoxyribonuclease RuvC [Aminobacteriaceae bacterium]MDD3915849.1 crossover junction endodeoxyribonuclease RuvC [Synergistaceae bacterium]NLD96983.1 crossover junction endodeoxyribonuclease RuvC [Synergistaceae bacterium]
MLKCIGIDPGLGRMGVATVLQDGRSFRLISGGCIETSPGEEISSRLDTIFRKLGEQIECCSPDFMSVEKLFFGRNITTAEYVWQARGIALLLAARYRLPLFEPKPSQIKLTVCGYGTAPKEQVQKMVQRLLGLKEVPKPDDVADAIGAAITGFSLFAEKRRISSAGGYHASLSRR